MSSINYSRCFSWSGVKMLLVMLFCGISGLLSAQDLSNIYKEISPAVVVIFTEEQIIDNVDGNNLKTTSTGLGTGFMISDTQIVTAAHVVYVAERIKVLFADGKVIPAQVIHSHKTADVAVIELVYPKDNAVTVSFADSDSVEVGNQIFIVGYPFGLGQSLSSGYVSGFKRPEEVKNLFEASEFIQTDAAINTGNSGGPMFNLQGEVVGIVSHITTVTGGFQGIGFATSSNMAQYVLFEKNSPWSGADLYPISGELAKEFGIPQESGLLVQRVVFSSPLGRKGLVGGSETFYLGDQSLIVGGDIILAINDITIDDSNDSLVRLAAFAADLTIDSNFEITVFRDGKVVVLGRR